MFAVIAEKRQGFHFSSSHFLISAEEKCDRDDFDEILNIKDYDILGYFDDENEAKKFMEKVMTENTKTYTRELLNKGELPKKEELSMTHSRFLFVYIGEDLTSMPGIYCVPIHHFFVLSEIYPSIRIANNEEIDKVEAQKTIIPVNTENPQNNGILENADLLLQLGGIHLTTASTSEEIEVVENSVGMIGFSLNNLVAELRREDSNKQKLDEYSKSLLLETGIIDGRETVPENIIDMFQLNMKSLMNDVVAETKRGATDEQCVEYIIPRLISILQNVGLATAGQETATKELMSGAIGASNSNID